MVGQIEKNIEIPRSARKQGVAEFLRRMEFGDSAVADRDEIESYRRVSRRHGIKLITRKISQTEFRFWRVS